MKKSLVKICFLPLFLLSVVSCDFSNPFAPTSSSENGHIQTSLTLENEQSSQVKGKSYYRTMMNDYIYYSPSLGNVKALVVPVQFKGSTTIDTDENIKSNLNASFFGTSQQTNYWESLASYYSKSSYNQMTLDGEVTDVYTTDDSLPTLRTRYKDCTSITNHILTEFYSKNMSGTSPKYKASDYDSDNDGVIDLVWLVYLNKYSSADESGLLWAYTYWISDTTIAKAVRNYSWGSYYFITDPAQSSKKLDAHTLIHETGHQMGLDDYYSYDDSPAAPLGGFDMMDCNILDHNSLSKYDLGWITPTVGEKDKTYNLKPFESSGDSLIIASNFNGTCFDEYFILEYYTPTGLNYLDSHYAYGNYPKGFTTNGLKILHVNQRLGKMSYTSSGWKWDSNYYNQVDPLNSPTSYYGIVSSNSKMFCQDDAEFCLLGLVQPNSFNLLIQSKNNYATNSDLFNSTNEDKFSSSRLTTHEGWKIPYSIHITNMNDSGVSITLSEAN